MPNMRETTHDIAIAGGGIAGMATAARLQASGCSTIVLRGRIIPALFLELTYHLEHHLYPQVPSHHLKELASRLDPFFDRVGVARWRVP